MRTGVRTSFSPSGNQIVRPDTACIDAAIRIAHVRHETAAAFMVDAWTQVPGELGVDMLTAWPAISNGIVPLYPPLRQFTKLSRSAASKHELASRTAAADCNAVAPLLNAARASALPTCINVAIDGQPAPSLGRCAPATTP